jgi:CHAT domain-containing protein
LITIIGTLHLPDARLVTLSACDTGITESSRAADEHVGLPAAFIAAGAAAVISSLWPVDDFSTMLLMERLYTIHLGGASVASALREAQLWLRELQVQDVIAWLDTTQTDLGSDRVLESGNLSLIAQTFQGLEPKDRPFANPYYWAPFILSGA